MTLSVGSSAEGSTWARTIRPRPTPLSVAVVTNSEPIVSITPALAIRTM